MALGFPGGSVVKNLPATQDTRVRSLGREVPLEKKWQPTPVFLQRVRCDLLTKQQSMVCSLYFCNAVEVHRVKEETSVKYKELQD